MNNTKQFNKSNPVKEDLIFPIQVKKMTDKETREYHLKKLYELSKKERAKLEFKVDGAIWKDGKPITEEPDYFQKQWIDRKMKSWRFY
jgi:hypothetical protein